MFILILFEIKTLWLMLTSITSCIFMNCWLTMVEPKDRNLSALAGLSLNASSITKHPWARTVFLDSWNNTRALVSFHFMNFIANIFVGFATIWNMTLAYINVVWPVAIVLFTHINKSQCCVAFQGFGKKQSTCQGYSVVCHIYFL